MFCMLAFPSLLQHEYLATVRMIGMQHHGACTLFPRLEPFTIAPPPPVSTVRYLPVRLSWPALSAVSAEPALPATPAVSMAELAGGGGGPELGIVCELALVEMRVDQALSLMHQRQQQEQRPGGGGGKSSSGSAQITPPVGATPAAAGGSGATTAPATPALATAAAAVASTADGRGGNGEGPAGGGGGFRGGRNGRERSVRRSPEDMAREAAESLAIADGAILQLEPWFAAVELSVGGGGGEVEGGRRAGAL